MADRTYQLIDFGGGRKLESIAGHLIDRPSPAADQAKRTLPGVWQNVDAYFDAGAKVWNHRKPWPDEAVVDCNGFLMPVRPTPYGHIGLFPEQQSNWQWLQDIEGLQDINVQSAATEPAKALNLFGYTGASTMALVTAGFSVAHVDAAKPNVHAVRSAAALNGRSDAPIRYLVDDAAKFVAREIRRENTYHTIVLDPPAYGHAPGGRAWRLERDLWPLLNDCLKLISPSQFRLLITGHSPQVSQRDVVDFFHDSTDHLELDQSRLRIRSGRSQLLDQSGRKLDTGFFVRIGYNVDERSDSQLRTVDRTD